MLNKNISLVTLKFGLTAKNNYREKFEIVKTCDFFDFFFRLRKLVPAKISSFKVIVGVTKEIKKVKNLGLWLVVVKITFFVKKWQEKCSFWFPPISVLPF